MAASLAIDRRVQQLNRPKNTMHKSSVYPEVISIHAGRRQANGPG